jgi:type IV pilus assembly protein PilY1
MDKLEGLSASAANSYANFTTNRASRTPQVYVGANDGMLHAFNALTGAETFAFIPSTILPNLRELTYNGYSHRFFVDGPTTSGDVYDGSQWRTILVGTLRSGGKSVFALDVTDPANISLLWEYSDADLGFVYGRPAIVRLHNGTWGVVFGNGYNSTNQKAVLYVLNATTGALLSKLNTGSGDATNPNGLASASPMDINGDLVVDYVYAGDLLGNLWRFDLLDTSNADALRGTASVPARSNSPANTWQIGYGGTPLFAAKDAASPANRQPITTNIVAAPHQTGTGIMVMFGTGKYLEASDALQNTTLTQSYYGIWDRYVLGEATTSAFLSPTIDRSRLQPQTLSTQTSETFVRDESGTPVNVVQTVRTVSNNAVAWYDYTTNPVTRSKDGWYIDFREGGVNLGEILVTDSLLIGNNVVFATTTPSSDPCTAGVERWVWSLDIQSGGRTDTPAFDLNNDGVIDDFDKTSNGNINNSVRVEGFGAPSAVGERIYLNLDDSIQTELMGLGGNNIRRSWRVIR